MNKYVKSTVVLVCICAVVALLLAAVNVITAPIIKKNQDNAANEALLQVLPNGKDFEAVDISKYTLPATITEAYSEAGGGYVFKLTTTGYASGFVIMCGINADGTVSGALCLSSSETLGYEKTYGEKLVGVNSETVDAVDTISGATKTTGAFRAAVKDSLNAAIILGGGSVDLRTEEEILMDALTEVLPEGEGKFSKVFITEIIEGIDAIYAADNGKGYVCIVGEAFVAVDQTGAVKSEDSAEISANVSAQMQKIIASTLTDVDISAVEGIPSAIVSVKKTASGNYVIDVKGAGYGINGGNEYHPASGEYIYIRVSMTKDGKIIDCLTVSQAETPNIGSVCGEEKFYGQFVGKTEQNYDQIDAITGATMTTNGYKTAILRAFEAVKLIEG